MSIETYEALTARFDLYAKLQEGLDDVAAGRTRPLDEFMQELQNRRSLDELLYRCCRFLLSATLQMPRL